jgi:hypothetical protein
VVNVQSSTIVRRAGLADLLALEVQGVLMNRTDVTLDLAIINHLDEAAFVQFRLDAMFSRH